VTNLSELLPSGGGAKEFDAIASGTLPSGQTVALKADGKVEEVALSSAALGTEASLSFGGNQGPSVCKLTDTTFVMTARDANNSNQATYVIGTVSNGSITFGTKALISSIGSGVEHLQAFPLTTDKFVVLYKDGGDGNKGKAIVGEVSGGSAGFGNAVTFETGQTSLNNVNAGVALSSTKFIIVFEDLSASSNAKAVVCTVSGTTITPGTIYTYNTANSSKYGVVDKLTDTKVIIAYSETPQGERGRALVATISGTALSFGSQVTYDDGGSLTVVFHSIVAMSETQFVISYVDKGDNNYGKSIVGSVSGTTITMGSTTDFNIACKNYVPVSIKLNATQFAVAFSPDQAPYTQRELKIGTISSGTITFGSAIQFHIGDSNSTNYLALVGTSDLILSYDTATVFSARDYQLESTNASNFIGITSEAIANGATGKVNPQGGVATAQAISGSSTVGAATVFETANATRIASCYDSTSNRIAVSYVDTGNGDHGTVAVGTVNSSNNSISFGTPVEFTGTPKITDSNIVFDSNSNRIVVGYFDEDNNNYGTAIVGTIDPSNNSISFGSPTVYEQANMSTSSRNFGVFDSNSNKVIFGYADSGDSNKGKAVVGTVDPSDNSITFGTPAEFESGYPLHMDATFDSSNNRVVIAYRDYSNSDYGTSVVGTVSGTSISFGTPVVYNAAESDWNSIVYDSSNNKVVIAYTNVGSSHNGTAIVGTVSGTTINFVANSSVVFAPVTATYIYAAYDSNLNKIMIGYRDGDNSDRGDFVIGTVSGTSISFNSPATFESQAVTWVRAAFDSNAKRTVFTFNPDNTNGSAVVVQPAGMSEAFTVGSTYYIQNNGNINTTSSSVTAGKAISTTQLILNGAS